MHVFFFLYFPFKLFSFSVPLLLFFLLFFYLCSSPLCLNVFVPSTYLSSLFISATCRSVAKSRAYCVGIKGFCNHPWLPLAIRDGNHHYRKVSISFLIIHFVSHYTFCLLWYATVTTTIERYPFRFSLCILFLIIHFFFTLVRDGNHYHRKVSLSFHFLLGFTVYEFYFIVLLFFFSTFLTLDIFCFLVKSNIFIKSVTIFVHNLCYSLFSPTVLASPGSTLTKSL